MAEGSYVYAYDSIWTSPKIRRFKEELRLASMEVAGAKFLKLMQWARDRVESGELGTVDPALLAEAMGLERKRGVEVIQALRRAQLVSTQEPGRVHGWAEGPGRLVERRRYEREKKQRQRGGGRDEQGRFTHESAGRPSGQAPSVPGDHIKDSERLSPGTSPGMSPGLLTRRTYTPLPPREETGTGDTTWAEERGRALVDQAEGVWRVVLQRLVEDAQREGTYKSFVTYLEPAQLEERGEGYVITVASVLHQVFVIGHYRSTIVELLGTDDVSIEVRASEASA